jgi:type I restriction enzyme S subunit
MRRYEKYKDSGIDWIGEIPEHWKAEKLGWQGIFSASGIDKKTIKGEPLVNMINYTDIYGNRDLILTSDRKYMIVSCPETKKEIHQVKIGDLIFTPSSETADEIGLSALVSEELPDTVYSYHVIRLRFTQDFDISFRKYLCNNNFILNQFSREAKGTTRQIIGRDVFKNIQVVIPPKPEQTAIANYLDRKTTQIDQLIAGKKRLLELYEEEKTAIINKAVTKGIKAIVKMKDSGIDWLGKIPEHWEVVKFNHYVYLRHGYQFRDYDFTSSGIKIIKITQLKANGELDTDNVSFIDENRLNDFQDIIIKDGDILMALTGGTIGKIIRVDKVKEPLLQNYRVGNFFPSKDKLNKSYLFWVLSSNLILEQIFFDQRETGQPNIGKEDFGKMFFLLPNKEEQTAIVQYIEKEIARINAKAEKTKKLIELLKEYKQALISEVVTGKIKVD